MDFSNGLARNVVGVAAHLGAAAPARRGHEAAHKALGPKISIVMPCLNAAATLRVAIRSVHAQVFDEWELLLVDNGSDDATTDLAYEAARRDDRIRVLHETTRGVSPARNLGVSAARGEWILFLDADDTLDRNALRKLHRAASGAQRPGVVVARSARIDGAGRQWRSPHWDLTDPFMLLAYECGIVIHAALVRREVVVGCGGFDEALRTAEDWDLWQRLARSGVSFVQIDAVLARYRSRPGSLSKSIRQLAADTLTVMERGARPDPRVRVPLTQYAYGAPAEGHLPHKLNFLLWSAARDIAGGGDGLELLAMGGGPPDLDVEPERMGEMLAAGMADFLAVQPIHLASRWAEFAPKLRSVLEAAFPGAERARIKDLVLLAIKSALGVAFDGADATLVHEVRQNLRAPWSSPGPGPAIVQLSMDGIIGLVALAGEQPAPAQVGPQLRQLAMRTALRSAKVWRWPRFWSHAAAAFLSAPWVDVLARAASVREVRAFARQRLRFACRMGLQALAPETEGRRPRRRFSVIGSERRSSGFASEVPLLMYHRVADVPPGPFSRYAVGREAFRRQVEALAKAGFWTPSAGDLHNALFANCPFSGRPVIFTFDDGYEDFAENAWPILREHGFGAIVFPVAAHVGGLPAWEKEPTDAPLMTWDTLRELSAEGVEIGSHSATHRRFSRLPLLQVREEAARSRSLIGSQIGRAPTVFCYPYGLRDTLVDQEVAAAGYQLAMSCRPGLCRLTAPPLNLPRIEVANWHGPEDVLRAIHR